MESTGNQSHRAESQNQGNMESTPCALAGKYLTFALSKETYGIEILQVVEIFGVPPITKVPRCPEFMKGVINLRGKIIPVVDLRLKFGLPVRAYDEKTCVVVINLKVGESQMALGVIVDTVLEVRTFTEESIAPAPNYGASLPTEFVIGMGKMPDGNVTILVDLNQLFDSAEAGKLTESVDMDTDSL